MINFPFRTNGNLLFIGVPILKHITVYSLSDKETLLVFRMINLGISFSN